MTKRVHRASKFNVTVEVKDDSFMSTPRPAQRNWMLNKSLREFADELEHLDTVATSFVQGAEPSSMLDREQCELSDQQIMEDWQFPVMKAMVEAITSNHGDVLEIGFGRGVASELLQRAGVRSHTICECNASVIARFESWKAQYPDANIQMLDGLWQDRVEDMLAYDGIFFHTYPLNEQDFVEQVVQSVTFAEHFFTTAAGHLRPGGAFTYLTNEFDSLSRAHQRLLFEHFQSFHLSKVNDLEIPEDTQDAMWSNAMVIVKAIK